MIVKLQVLEDDRVVYDIGTLESPRYLDADTRMKADTRDEFVSQLMANLYGEFMETKPDSDSQFLEYLAPLGWVEVYGPDLTVTL